MDCLGCGSPDYFSLVSDLQDTDSDERLDANFRDMRFNFVCCNICKTVYLRDRVTQEEIGRFYSTEYHCFQSFEERGLIMRLLGQALTRQKLQVINKLMPKGSDTVLDYGCGSGAWLEMMQAIKCPWKLMGTDILNDEIEMVRRMGIEAFLCDELTLADQVAGKKIGVVHMNHVIEHLPDPIRVLKSINEVMQPGGIIYGQTPNIESVDCRLFGADWAQWHVPRHLVMYTPSTLRTHAEAAGFETVFVVGSLSAATNWANSILKAQARKAGERYKLGSNPLYPLLILSMIPVTALQMLFSSTSNLDFAFRKPR